MSAMTSARLLCLVFALSLRAGAQQLPPAGYTPLAALSDEFDGEVLDAAKWTAAASGWKGRQPGLFDPSNAVVGGGALQLWARAARRNASWPAGYDNYTTAYVQSVATVREGYFEIRWRSGNSGISSSWWLHAGNATEWTEIDVFESTGVDNPSRSGALARDFASTTHIFKLPGSNASSLPARCNCTEDDGGGSCSRRAVWQLPAGQSFAEAFHIAGLLWDDSGIRVFLDGALVNTVPSPCLIEVSGGFAAARPRAQPA
jgi:beta-glucanase (GH16 family)